MATVPPLVFGLESHRLTTAGVSLSHRELAGAELALVLLASLAVLVVAGGRLLAVEPRLKSPPIERRRMRRLAARARRRGSPDRVLAVVGVLARARRHLLPRRGQLHLDEIGDQRHQPDRLLSADSENRWVWWKEALGAFSDRPIGGWGAGSLRSSTCSTATTRCR